MWSNDVVECPDRVLLMAEVVMILTWIYIVLAVTIFLFSWCCSCCSEGLSHANSTFGPTFFGFFLGQESEQRRIAVEQVAREQSEREVAVALARSRCAACNGAHRSHTCGVSAAERNAANYSAAVVMEAAAAAVPAAVAQANGANGQGMSLSDDESGGATSTPTASSGANGHPLEGDSGGSSGGGSGSVGGGMAALPPPGGGAQRTELVGASARAAEPSQYWPTPTPSASNLRSPSATCSTTTAPYTTCSSSRRRTSR